MERNLGISCRWASDLLKVTGCYPKACPVPRPKPFSRFLSFVKREQEVLAGGGGCEDLERRVGALQGITLRLFARYRAPHAGGAQHMLWLKVWLGGG